MSAHISNVRPEFDREIVDIVDYVMNYAITSTVAYDTAHYCLLDTLGAGWKRWNIRPVKNCWGRLSRGRWCRTVFACRAPSFSSIRCRQRLTLAR